MTEPLSPAERLRQHFSNRVINQTRQVIDLWRQLPQVQWHPEQVQDLILAADKLVTFARRFEALRHEKLASQLLAILQATPEGGIPDGAQLEKISEIIITLSRTALRHTDQNGSEKLIPSKKSIYLALTDTTQALTIAEQMEYFGLHPQLQRSAADLNQALASRHPAALVLDLDLEQNGPAIARQLQDSRESSLPVIFTCRGDAPELPKRLEAMRAGGVGIYSQNNVQGIIGHLEQLLDTSPEPAAKVLIVDDSRAQSAQTAQVLNRAGKVTQICNDPLEVLRVMREFAPDLVLMDMYMPGCTGVELARVIRQQGEYINLPIIYLSGEEDRERQLAAMAEGGDDFLTKPVRPEHLLTTIRTRIKRARQLHDLIARDSLTGLLNHTHLLGALDSALHRAGEAPLCFVMIDIDHFKQVNDQFGHPLGDVVIRNLALFLRQNLRKTDPIGRYGGEEFAVVLAGADAAQASRIVNDIRDNFSRLIHDGSQLRVTFSCGIAQWTGESLSELVSAADKALYRAKHNGRNQVHTA